MPVFLLKMQKTSTKQEPKTSKRGNLRNDKITDLFFRFLCEN